MKDLIVRSSPDQNKMYFDCLWSCLIVMDHSNSDRMNLEIRKNKEISFIDLATPETDE